MVFNVAASSGGALSVLEDFYNEVRSDENKNINWFFVVSKPEFEETENIKILRFPWVKKSWMHRIYFDNIIASNLIRNYKIDKVLSLQNITIPFTNVPQVVYMHQSLPFADYRFSFQENRVLWVYQNIIGKKIIKSLKVAQKVIVQTNWIKEACIKASSTEDNKYCIIPPKTPLKSYKLFKPNEESFRTFFYPANGEFYKNHRIIVEACKKLRNNFIKDFKVIFTLDGTENEQIKEVYEEVKRLELPIEFIGKISRDEVYCYYTQAVLLFPSYIETYGLPLLEAKSVNSVILASSCLFSYEVLDKYNNAHFFNPHSSDELVELMVKSINQQIDYSPPNSSNYLYNKYNDLSISGIILNRKDSICNQKMLK